MHKYLKKLVKGMEFYHVHAGRRLPVFEFHRFRLFRSVMIRVLTFRFLRNEYVLMYPLNGRMYDEEGLITAA